MKLKIDVTQNDINCGKRRRCTKCPVALAVRRVLGEPVKVQSFSIHYKSRRIAMSRKVEDFVRRFDERQPVRPFSFVFDTEGATF